MNRLILLDLNAEDQFMLMNKLGCHAVQGRRFKYHHDGCKCQECEQLDRIAFELGEGT